MSEQANEDTRTLTPPVEVDTSFAAVMAALAPEGLMKSWMSFGTGATEQFRKLVTAATTGAAFGTKPPE